MNNIRDCSFEDLVTPFVLKNGYKRAPGQLDFVFIKPPYALTYYCEEREHANVYFGLVPKNVDLLFGDFSLSSINKNLYPFEHWLGLIKRDSTAFSQARGGWTAEGLRMPDFDCMSSILIENLHAIQQIAAND